MELTLQRGKPVGEALSGEMWLNGEHYCYTLERVAVAIPAGRYQLGVHQSPRFGRPMPILLGTDPREDILIHWGNYPEDTDGCILVGESEDGISGTIYNTRAQFDTLWRLIAPLLAPAAEGVWITIQDYEGV